MHEVLPWHRALAQNLKQQKPASGAIIVYGPKGAGKTRLLRSLVSFTDADVWVLAPEEGQSIGVQAIRELASFTQTQPRLAPLKEIVVLDAERVTLSAWQALLKPLEEPAVRLRYWLVTQQLSQLPLTIRSRCQQYRVPYPCEEEALRWLQAAAPEQSVSACAFALHYAEGLPVRAAAALADPRLSVQTKVASLDALLQKERTARSFLKELKEQADLLVWFELLPAWFSMLRFQEKVSLSQIADLQTAWQKALCRLKEVPGVHLKLELYTILYSVELLQCS